MQLTDVTRWLLRLIALMQGCFTIGIMISIGIVYFKKVKRITLINCYVVAVALGLCCLIGATLITMYRNIYMVGDVWFWLTLPGYVLSDFALLVMIIKLKQGNFKKNKNEI